MVMRLAALCLLTLLPTALLAQSSGSLLPADPNANLPVQRDAYPLFPDPGRPRSAIPENQGEPAEQVVAGLSDNSVSITTSFDGSEILIYGAIRREVPIPDDQLDVIVTVEAPSQPLTVWRKQRRFGIWVNTERVEVGAAPSYYAVASTAPLDQILLPGWDSRYRISLSQALRAFSGAPEVQDVTAFTEAMIRLRENDGHYRLDEAGVELAEDTLFRADIRLPANLLEGDYKTRIFLLRDGQVVDVHRAAIQVRKVGLERWLYNLAYDQPMLYGLMSLAVAVFAGWGASAAFRKLRRA